MMMRWMQKSYRPPVCPLLLLCVCLICVWTLAACVGHTPDGTDTAAPTSPSTESEPTEAPTEETFIEEETTMIPETETEDVILPDTESATEPETETEPETQPETEPPTDAPTEPETDPVREPLELSVDVDPYVPEQPAVIRNVKAMWLSQFDLQAVYRASDGKSQREEDDFRQRIGAILQNVVDNGFNTVIVQVRPNADSMYPSEYYPPSTYVTGSYANDFTYDAFEILLQEARYLGLSVHAWINPLRGVTTSELNQMQSSYAIRQWYDDETLRGRYIVEVGGRWYLNPAYAEVRDLIVHGAREILERYDVDGIHMDDYFYPTTDTSFDSEAYAAYKEEGGRKNVATWRRENLSDLVSSLYRTVKKHDHAKLFGISPAGVLSTVVNKQYADVNRWCADPGFVDYILPQVYFGFEHATVPFAKTCDTWQELIKTDYVTLLIGMTFGKAQSKYDQYAGSGANEWAEHTDILARCVAYTEGLERCRGISIFCYQYFYHPLSGVPVAATQTERDNFTAALAEAVWGEEQTTT